MGLARLFAWYTVQAGISVGTSTATNISSTTSITAIGDLTAEMTVGGSEAVKLSTADGKTKAWKKNGTDQFEESITNTSGFYTSVTVNFTKFYLTSDTGKSAITGNALGAYAGTYNFKVAVDTSVAKCTAVLSGTEPTTVELLNAMANNTEVSFTLTIDASGTVSNDASSKAWVALRGSEDIKDGSEIGALKVING